MARLDRGAVGWQGLATDQLPAHWRGAARHGDRAERHTHYRVPPGQRRSPEVLTRDGAGALAAVGFVAPHRLNGVRLARQGNVLQAGPGALIAVFAGGGVVPAVLEAGQVARVGDRLGVLVAGDDAVAVQVAVPKRVVGLVDRIPAAAGALLGHVGHER